jgi:serine protease Do
MGDRIPAIVAGKDFETNIALIRVEHDDLKPLPLISSAVTNGSLGILLGNTYYSEGMACGWGILNQTWIGGGDFLDDKLLSIHIDWPGLHSGTPVLDVNGDLIGIAEGHLETFETAWTIIPAKTISIVAEKLILGGSIERGWLGIRSNPVCPRENTARLMKQWKGKGAVVSSLVTDSPADQAGFAVGDVVTEVNGERILCISDLRRMLTAMTPGTRVVVAVNRDGETFTVEIVLGLVPDDSQRQRRCIRRSA